MKTIETLEDALNAYEHLNAVHRHAEEVGIPEEARKAFMGLLYDDAFAKSQSALKAYVESRPAPTEGEPALPLLVTHRNSLGQEQTHMIFESDGAYRLWDISPASHSFSIKVPADELVSA
jgi:hypothetical protein